MPQLTAPRKIDRQPRLTFRVQETEPRISSVGGTRRVSMVHLLVQLHKELFDVAIEATLALRGGVRLHKGVVPAFHLHGDGQRFEDFRRANNTLPAARAMRRAGRTGGALGRLLRLSGVLLEVGVGGGARRSSNVAFVSRSADKLSLTAAL